jgi:DHA1 family bicyclomycin/chloramphenicol resistance-like MFS transporter
MKNNSLLRNALILGLITAMGPFAIDMYLPALPAIGTAMGDAKGAMLSLTAYFISFGICQMLYGTISDMYGRRPPLLAGLVLFVAAGIGCAFATSIPMLIALRFLQGIGGAAGVIITRAIVRDLYSGVEEVKMMSLLMLVFSVSPLLAPLSGSYIVEYFNWQAIFWVLAALGIAGIVLILTTLSETWPPEKRISAGFSSMTAAFAILIRDRAFVGMTLIGAFGITSFFIYLGNSAFVMTDYYHLSPRAFSIIFSVNAAAFFAAAQANGPLSKRFGIQNLIIPAATGCALGLCIMATCVLAGLTALPLVLSLMFLSFGCLGIVIPNIMVLALADHGEIAGTAASLMNTVQMVIGSAAIAGSGLFVNGTPLPMALGMAGSALLTLAVSIWTFGGRQIERSA